MDPDRAHQLLAGERERIEQALARLGPSAPDPEPGDLGSEDLYEDELEEGWPRT